MVMVLLFMFFVFFCLCSKNFLKSLIILEFLSVTLIIYCSMIFFNSNMEGVLMVFLSLLVLEGVVGLFCLILLVNFSGLDYININNLML